MYVYIVLLFIFRPSVLPFMAAVGVQQKLRKFANKIEATGKKHFKGKLCIKNFCFYEFI